MATGSAPTNDPVGTQTSSGDLQPSGGGVPAPDAGRPAYELSIVVPAYNEAARLASGRDRLAAAVRSGAVDPSATELIVVDDGSTDATSERAASVYASFEHLSLLRLPRNTGKGAAVRAGFEHASGATIAFADADMSIDPVQLPRLTAALAGADLAIASRTQPGSSVEGGDRTRHAMGRVFSRVANALTGVGLDDTQCGCKAFRGPVAKLLFHFGAVDRFAFDLEVLALARRFGLRIAEVPVQWRQVPGSRIRPLRDGAATVASLVTRRLVPSRPRTVEAVEVPVPAAELASLPAPAGLGPDVRPQPDVASPVVASPDAPLPVATLPVVALPEGSLVLFALCGAESAARWADSLAAAWESGGARRRTLAVDDLAALAPLDVTALTIRGAADSAATDPAMPGRAASS